MFLEIKNVQSGWSSSSLVVLKQEWFWPTENIWQCPETFSVITRGERYVCYWCLVSRGQWCPPPVSCTSQDSPPLPKQRTQVSLIAGRCFTSWATREAQRTIQPQVSIVPRLRKPSVISRGIRLCKARVFVLKNLYFILKADRLERF